jgi:transporter family-2 protein
MQSFVFVIFIGLACGGALSLLSPLSSMINKRLGVLETVVIVHISGLLAGIVILLVTREGFGNLDRWHELPWYLLLAGALGLVVISSFTYLIPNIGITASVLITVTAQLAVSAFLDHFGFLGAEVRLITVLRALGIAVMFLGVWLTVRERKERERTSGNPDTLVQDDRDNSDAIETKKETSRMRTLLLVIAVGLASGAAMGLQSPMYSAINQHLGMLESVVIVHFTGTFAALLALLVYRKGAGKLPKWRKLPWHLKAAGMLGVVVISAYSYMIPQIGVTTSVLLTVTAQMTFSSILDHYGFLGTDVRRITLSRLSGIVVMFLGVWLTVR